MSFFDKRSISILSFVPIFEKGSSYSEKIDLIRSDVETEGKKHGYEKAAKQYEPIFRSIMDEYNKAIELIESQKSLYNCQSNVLISELETLEKRKHSLENQVKRKKKAVSDKYGIPLSKLNESSAGSESALLYFDLVDIFYRHKKRKYMEAEQRGYLEAKILYEKKIAILKNDLAELKNQGNTEVNNFVALIDIVLSSIAEEQMKNAELEIILHGDSDE